MTVFIPNQYILDYTSETQLAYQFGGDKLASRITMGNHTGEGAAAADFVAATHANENPGRLAPTPSNNADIIRPWVYPNYYDHAFQIANQDIDRLFNASASRAKYAENQGKAMARKRDDYIAAALFSSRQIGKNGATADAFPTGAANVVAPNFEAAANTGITVSKLIQAKTNMQGLGVDIENEKIYSIIDSVRHNQLLKQIELRSKDFNEKPVLNNGIVQSYLGIDFIHMEFTNTTFYPNAAAAMIASTIRYIPLFTAASMYWGQWKDVNVQPSFRNDLSGAFQLYSFAEGGAVRLQNVVQRIDCID
jgi:hypothetical protein